MSKQNWIHSAAFCMRTRGYAVVRPATEWHIAFQWAMKISMAEGCQDKEYLVSFDPQVVITRGKIERLKQFENPAEHKVWHMAMFKNGKITHNPSNDYVQAFLEDCRNETAKADADVPAVKAVEAVEAEKPKKGRKASNTIDAKAVQNMIAENNKSLIADLLNAMKA